ncbi:MAG: type II toxin-antitoxin system PemK/MazF family toxin [bacterium]
MVIRRGELWWADLDTPIGLTPDFRRPVLVVQSDAFNHSGIASTIIVPLTTNIQRADAPGNVLIRARETGLRMDSVVNVSQPVAVDRRALVERIGTVNGATMASVARGLRLVLDTWVVTPVAITRDDARRGMSATPTCVFALGHREARHR